MGDVVELDMVTKADLPPEKVLQEAIAGGITNVVVIGYALNWMLAIGFLIGAVLSGLAGFLGMKVSVHSNAKSAQAAHKGMGASLALAFRAGAVADERR